MNSPDPVRHDSPVDNPLRDAQRDGVRDELEGRLRHRGAAVTDAESDDDILALSNAVDMFEHAVMRAGGDLMVDTPESSRPDNPALVLPQRRDDEPVTAYVERIRAAAGAIARAG